MTSKRFQFARRTDWPLSTNDLISTLEDLRGKNLAICDLTESNPTRCGFKYPADKILNVLSEEKNLDYNPNPKGILEAREGISRYYKTKGFYVPADRIILTAGTSEAYSYLFRLLANPGQEVLFPRPSYPLFEFLVDLNDVDMQWYPLEYHDGWTMNLEKLKSSVHSDTKAVVLVNPNNPTGSFTKRHELDALNEVCLKNSSAIISDEVFWDFAFYHDENFVSLAENKKVLTFVLGGISKTLGLPQMKLSWIVVSGPDELVEQAIHKLELISDTYLSVNTPTQNSLIRWLLLKDQIQKELKDRISRNYNNLKRMVQDSNRCKLLNTEGGWYAIVFLPDYQSEDKWVSEFLTQDYVFVHPGYFFDMEDEPSIVISLLPPEENFKAGVKKLFDRVEAHRSF